MLTIMISDSNTDTFIHLSNTFKMGKTCNVCCLHADIWKISIKICVWKFVIKEAKCFLSCLPLSASVLSVCVCACVKQSPVLWNKNNHLGMNSSALETSIFQSGVSWKREREKWKQEWGGDPCHSKAFPWLTERAGLCVCWRVCAIPPILTPPVHSPLCVPPLSPFL